MSSGRRTVGSVFDGFHSSSLPTDIGPTHLPCRATASLTVRHRYRSDASKLLDLSGTYAFTSPLTLLAVPLVGSLYVVSAVTAGRVLGYVAAWFVATVPFVARHKGRAGRNGRDAVFGGYFLFQVPQLPVSGQSGHTRGDPDWMACGPAGGWDAHRLVVDTRFSGSGGGWRGARRWGWLAERIATSLWFGESVDVSDTGKASVSPRMKEDKRPLAQAIRPLGVPFITGPTRHVVEWSLLASPSGTPAVELPVYPGVRCRISSSEYDTTRVRLACDTGPASAVLLWDGLLARRSVSTRSVMKGRPAGNPDCRVRAGVRPGTHRSVSAVRACRRSRHARCCTPWGPRAPVGDCSGTDRMLPHGRRSDTRPDSRDVVPRYSAIRIGNSDGVRPPRLLAGALHVASVWLPGAALVGLVAAPELVQLGLSGIGYVPGFIPQDGR